ncbi:type II toxin-antitoxin system VapB family antitoxin [Symbioplanes lichenis]|uniref:type II toxin-antitoxin system VapB family antitoxin n=1 Tax=Symbioplanes lichenis TaxID=1629072 RepID=UPI0027390F05|nr:type II toxin-antitoxin system VapB family antitoxin [Actinoplanes lichenis]
MTERRIDVDDKALAAAAAYLKTTSPEETINAALRRVAKMLDSSRAMDELVTMAKNGDFDLLLDKRNYRPRPTLPPLREEA